MATSRLMKLLFLALISVAAIELVQPVRGDEVAEEDIDVEVDLDDEVDVEDLDGDEPEEEEVELEDDEEVDEEDEEPEASVDAETTLIFVDANRDYPEFRAGSKAQALIGFHNIGSRPFFVQSVEGSFRYTQDFRYFRQNFSLLVVNTTVPAGEQTTFTYDFTPSEVFDPQDVGFVINVNYADDDGTDYRDAVFNDTAAIGDSNIEVDVVGSLVYYGALAVGGYLVYQHLFAKDSKKTSKPSRELGTKKADSEWLTDMQKPKQKK